MTPVTSKTFLLLTSVFLYFCVIQARQDDEFYCKFREDKYMICRRCPNLNEDCEEPLPNDGCKCANLEFANFEYEFVGGPNQCEKDDPFCYVTEGTNCADAEYSSTNDRFKNLWLNSEVYYSYDACNNSKRDNTGNENVVRNVKIKGDYLREVDDTGKLGQALTFYFQSHEDCRAECASRVGQCGAWSFDTFEEICYLHTAYSCCGQFDKRESDSNFISGYTCDQCWSTRNDCPCGKKNPLPYEPNLPNYPSQPTVGY